MELEKWSPSKPHNFSHMITCNNEKIKSHRRRLQVCVLNECKDVVIPLWILWGRHSWYIYRGDWYINHVVCSNDHKDASHIHMTYQNLIFHHTHEEEQDTNSMIKSINLANLMTNKNLVNLLHIAYDYFNQGTVDLTIPYICIYTHAPLRA